MIKKNALVLYAKKPEVGKVKTRLTQGINQLTPEMASALYSAILEDLIILFSNSSQASNYDFFICPKGDSKDFKETFDYKYTIINDTGDGNLGTSMYNTFSFLFNQNYHNVCIIGSDIPFLNENSIENTFNKLDSAFDFVIGGDQSGGCYLIAAKKLYDIFNNITWSQGMDFKILTDRARNNKINTAILPEEIDIDNFDDLIKVNEKINQDSINYKVKMKNTFNFLFHVKQIFS
ncbi:MAG: DUF2064 domain-containing protein [Spirochaetota bacterium]|nr:DUF2064 domain-containing protein [Spirochaetota bacterium]